MKVKIYVLVFLIIFIPSILFSEEFRGLKWGIDMNEIINFESDFIFFNRSGNIRSYIRRGEKKRNRTHYYKIHSIFILQKQILW